MKPTLQSLVINNIIIFLMLCILGSAIIFPHTLDAKQADDLYTKVIRSGIKDLEQNRDSKKRIAAAKLLGYHDTPESIRALATALVTDKDPKVRNAAADSLWKHGKKAGAAQDSLTAALKDTSPGVRVSSSWALQVQGVEPEKLVDARRSVLEDKESDTGDLFWAAKGLIDFDPPLSLVQYILEYAKAYIRSKPAERALKDLAGRQDRGIIPAMVEMVGEYHKGNGIILEGMEEFNPTVENMVGLICQQFSHNDNELTTVSLILLERHTGNVQDVSFWLPFVKPYTSDPDQAVRMHAVRLIGRAGGLAYDALPELLQVMRVDPEPSVRQGAIEAVGLLGDRTKSFPESMKKGVGEKAAGELSRMIKIDPDKQVRNDAVRTLDKLITAPADVVPVFVDAALTDDYPLVRMSALQALRDRGKDAAAALPDLKKLLDHSDPSIRNNALWTIQAIEKEEVPIDKPLQASTVSKNEGQEQALASLRERGVTFDERGFMLALSSTDIGKVRAYLDSGISANYRFASKHDQPALSEVFANTTMFAMLKKPLPAEVKELVRLLLERGADPNLTDKRGNTPLMMAAMGCDAELLQMLIDAGADPHVKSVDGLTAIEFTIAFANQGASALIKAGAGIPPDKVESYRQFYADSPDVLELIERASEK